MTSYLRKLSTGIGEHSRVVAKQLHVEELLSYLKARSLANPAAGFRGGGNLARGPNIGYPKTENSTEIFFWGWNQIHLRKKIKTLFGSYFWGRGKRHNAPPFLGFEGAWPGCPPPPGSASEQGTKVRNVWQRIANPTVHTFGGKYALGVFW